MPSRSIRMRHRSPVRMLLVAALAFAAVPASAQTDASAGYPRQPIRIICGFAAGATPDLVARLIAPKLSERIGQPVIVETKPGAGGVIAAEHVARSAPDGYVLLVAPGSTLSVNPAVYSKLPYDAVKSFVHVVNVATNAFILAVRADHPSQTPKDLVAWSQANAASANYGSASAILQLSAELFKLRTGAKFEYIPFKGGGEMVTALLSGQVQMTFNDPGSVMPQIRGTKIRALAVTGSKRMSELPDVPTLAEAGVPDVVVEGYSGLVAPAGTPAAIVKRIESEVQAVVQLADVRERLTQMGMVPSGEGTTEFGARIAREIAMWTTVAKAANIKLD